MRRVRAAGQAVEGWHIHGRDLLGQILAVRDQVRIVDAKLIAAETGQRRVHWNVDIVEAEGGAGFIDQRRANRPGPGHGVGPVRPIEVLSGETRALVERLIFEIGGSPPTAKLKSPMVLLPRTPGSVCAM